MKIAALLVALLLPFGAWAAEPGDVVRGYPEIPSGHRLVIKGAKVQLWGIEATPSAYPGGSHARQALKDLVKGHPVECMYMRGGDYGWQFARCLVKGVDMSEFMVSNGWAVNHDRFTKEFQSEEDWARMRCIGMWSGEMCGIFQSRYTQ